MKSAWILAALLLAWALGSTTAGVYYYEEYDKNQRLTQDLKQKLGEVSLSVNIAIDYGNDTRAWFNGTVVPVGATVHNATIRVAVVEHDPQFGASYIIAINGVRENNNEKMSWMWWTWEQAERKWILGPIANNEYVLTDGQTVIWYYENISTWPPQSP